MKLASLFAAAALCAATSAHADIVNGNFEAGWSGWSRTGNIALAWGDNYFGAGNTAQDGTTLVAFNAGDTAPNAQLWQTFATHAGDTVTIRFDYGTTGCGQGCQQNLNATVLGADGTTALATLTAAGGPGLALGSFSFAFQADGDFATLRFADVGSNQTVSLDGVLDNVRAEVPEPGSVALLGLGLLGVAATRRRARR